jgi:hypothetical protein
MCEPFFTCHPLWRRLVTSQFDVFHGGGDDRRSCRTLLNILLTAVVGFMLTGGFSFCVVGPRVV